MLRTSPAQSMVVVKCAGLLLPTVSQCLLQKTYSRIQSHSLLLFVLTIWTVQTLHLLWVRTHSHIKACIRTHMHIYMIIHTQIIHMQINVKPN